MPSARFSQASPPRRNAMGRLIVLCVGSAPGVAIQSAECLHASVGSRNREQRGVAPQGLQTKRCDPCVLQLHHSPDECAVVCNLGRAVT
jgi:hypothetical protein